MGSYRMLDRMDRERPWDPPTSDTGPSPSIAPESVRAAILTAANQYVSQIRNETYGSFHDNATLTSKFMSAYFEVARGRHPEAHDVAIWLIMHKIARIASGKAHLDNYVDIAGYAALAGEELFGSP